MSDPSQDTAGSGKGKRWRVSEDQWAKLRLLAVRFAVVVLLGAIALMVLKLAPSRVPLKQNPGFIDVIFASRAVITAVRALIIFGSAYAALSVIALIWNQQWLTGFAGAQTAKIERSVSGLAEERDRLATRLAESEETIQTLEAELRDVLAQLEETAADLDIALADRHSPGSRVLRMLKRLWQRQGGRM